MDHDDLKACIENCERSLTYVKEAMSFLDNEYSKQKLEHASRDIEELKQACYNALR